jgi:hypothetical protein
LVEPTLAARRAALLARYAKSVSADRASHDVDEILMAAEIGAVDVLFVDPAARLTGRYTSGNGRTHVDEQAQRNHHDLVDLAVGLVLRNSGAVETLAAADIPGGGPMAAILRYPFAPLRETIASGETR